MFRKILFLLMCISLVSPIVVLAENAVMTNDESMLTIEEDKIATSKAEAIEEDLDWSRERIALLPDLSEYDYRIWVNGTFIPVEVQPVKTEDGPLLVPLRSILEADQAKVKWTQANNSVQITSRNERQVLLNIGNGMASDGKQYRMKVVDGRTLIELSFFELFEGLDVTFDPAVKSVLVSSNGATFGDVLLYNFGESILHVTGNKEIPYLLNGAVSVPESDNNPVVVLLHGAHAVVKSDTNRYDLGFSYLMRALAAQGYSVLSMNVNMQYSFESGEPIESERMTQILSEQVDKLIELNETGAINHGENETQGVDNFNLGGVQYGISLKNKFDLNRVTMIGHSRSGQEIIRAVSTLDDKDLEVNGLLAVAPAYGTEKDYEYPEIPIGIIIPQQDGDVMLLEGQKFYDEIAVLPDWNATAHLVYLYEANHNAFNEALLYQDNGFSANDPTQTIPVMPQEKQRQILTSYVLDFLKVTTEDVNPMQILPYNQNGNFYEGKALISIAGQGYKRLLAAENEVNVAVLSVGEGVELKDVIASYFYKNNTAGVMRIPTCPLEMPLYQISWSQKGAAASIAIEEKAANFSGYQTLSFDLAQDSTSEMNCAADQGMTIRLTDVDNKSVDVHIPVGTASLTYQKGEIITQELWEGEIIQYYSNFTPLSSLRVSLDSFKGVNLSAVSKIELIFSDTDTGCLVIKTVSLMKK